MSDISSQIPALLQKIAQMASPAANYAWSRYMEQSYIIGVQQLVVAVVGVVAMVGSALGARAVFQAIAVARERHERKQQGKTYPDRFDADGLGAAAVALIAAGVVGACLAVANVLTAIPYLMNPAYYAIQALLGH